MNTQITLPQLISYPDTLSYSDGSEVQLYDIVSDQSFDEFTSWKNQHNWALYYHLSPLRRNILSWINYGRKPIKILELGAGCGAITSYLITVPDSEIVAVEGSFERAKVIQARCKGAGNLEIHACPIESYHPDCEFDIITLIGVLEYSGKYVKGHDDPFSYILKLTSGWLSEPGSLIVAIENQLGAKYLSGCAEDHYGAPYEGVNNYPNYNGVRTFTKTSLSKMLTDAGLCTQSWYYPYPDYKLPSLIYSDLAFDQDGFDFMALTDVPPEPNENTDPAFNDKTFLKLVRQVAPVGGFMNSFLTVASKTGAADFIVNNTGMVAVKSNVKFRRKPFQTSTSFYLKDERIEVRKARLYPECSMPDCDIQLNVTGNPEPYFYDNINAFDVVVNSVIGGDCDKALDTVNLWIDILKKKAVAGSETTESRFTEFMKKAAGVSPAGSYLGGQWVSGSYIDLVPLNILLSVEEGNKRYRIIDLEWQIPFDVPLQLVFDRGMDLLINKLQRITKSHNMPVDPKSFLPPAFHGRLKEVPLFLTMNAHCFTKFEAWFQHTIMGTIDVPQLDSFVETVVTFVEQGKKRDALQYYARYRQYYAGVRDLEQFDKIMETIAKCET